MSRGLNCRQWVSSCAVRPEPACRQAGLSKDDLLSQGTWFDKLTTNVLGSGLTLRNDPLRNCHSEPFGFAQDELREESRSAKKSLGRARLLGLRPRNDIDGAACVKPGAGLAAPVCPLARVELALHPLVRLLLGLALLKLGAVALVASRH